MSTLQALIGVLAIVFPDLLDSGRDLVLCTLSTNDLDGGLFFWSLSWNCSLLSLLGSIGLLSTGTKLLGWDLWQPCFNRSFKGLNSPSTKHEISLSWYLVKLLCAFVSPASIACYVLSAARVLLLALLELSLPFLEGFVVVLLRFLKLTYRVWGICGLLLLCSCSPAGFRAVYLR